MSLAPIPAAAFRNLVCMSVWPQTKHHPSLTAEHLAGDTDTEDLRITRRVPDRIARAQEVLWLVLASLYVVRILHQVAIFDS